MCIMNSMESKVKELQELVRMQEELEAEIEAAKDEIKAAMGSEEVMQAGSYRVTYKAVTSTRIDTAKLRKELPEVWTEYGKTSTTRRFAIA